MPAAGAWTAGGKLLCWVTGAAGTGSSRLRAPLRQFNECIVLLVQVTGSYTDCLGKVADS